jgi:hypothetical protein
MIKKMKNLLKGRSYSLLDDIVVISQEALHTVFGKIRKLRVMVAILVSVCVGLGAVSLKGQEAFPVYGTWKKKTRRKTPLSKS